MPTGTLFGTTTNASQVVDSADDNAGFLVTLTADAAVTVGDAVALVIINDAGTPGTMNIHSTWGAATSNQFPYGVTNTSGSYAKVSVGAPAFYIEYDDGSTPNVGTLPILSNTAVTFNSGTAPDERALYFQLPFPCKIAGVDMGLGAFSGNAEVILYDSDGTTALATVTLDKDIGRGGTVGLGRVLFGTPVTLSANTNYRIALKPTSASNVVLYDYIFGDAANLGAMDGGTNFHLSTQTNAGGWTETTTRRPVMSLLLSAFDDGVGGGGATYTGFMLQ
jgi:hypothetical protein